MTGTLTLKSMLKDREQAMADFTRWTATINLDFKQSGRRRQPLVDGTF
jgi:hypothetical protein